MGFNWWSLAPQNWLSDVKYTAEHTFLTWLRDFVQAFAYIVEWILYAVFLILSAVLNMLNVAAGAGGLFDMPIFFTLIIGLTLIIQVIMATLKDIPVVGEFI